MPAKEGAASRKRPSSIVFQRVALHLRHAGLGVILWSVLYYAMSILFVVSSKHVLMQVPSRPWMLSCCQCIMATICSRFWLESFTPGIQKVSPRQWRFVGVGSVTCFLGFACANVACSVMNASLVETIKATTPIPQVIIATYMGEGLMWSKIRALAVIVVGVMMASFADSSACVFGVVVSLFMNLAFAMADNTVRLSYGAPDSLDSANIWHRTCQASLIFAVPAAMTEVYFYPDGSTDYDGTSCWSMQLCALMIFSGVVFFLYNQAICQLLELVPISTFAVLGSVRRAVTIVALTLHFGTDVTALNVAGLFVVAVGFALYMAPKKKEPPVLRVVPPQKLVSPRSLVPDDSPRSEATTMMPSGSDVFGSPMISGEIDVEGLSA